jgi:hypothetical protein
LCFTILVNRFSSCLKARWSTPIFRQKKTSRTSPHQDFDPLLSPFTSHVGVTLCRWSMLSWVIVF